MNILENWKFFLTVVFFIHVVVWTAPAESSGYGYQSDVDRTATVQSARRILSETGGIFIGPEDIRALFNVDARVSYRTPFTERDLWDCGRCVLFPTVSHIGYRGKPATINNLWRAPEAKRLFRRGDSLSNPWFKREAFAREPLRTEWHLVRLAVEGVGSSPSSQQFYPGYEKPPKANVAFWMLLLLPPDIFAGERFFTADNTHGGRSIVTVGRPEAGAIHISHTPRIIGNTAVGRVSEIIPRSQYKHRR